jgi:hypothetical protein
MPTGKHVLRNAFISINGTAISDHASSLELEDEAEEVEFTAFSPNGYREFGQGLKDATITITFFQDYASGSVHSMLRPLYESGGTFSLVIGPSASEAISSTNPRGTMISRLYSYGGLSGEVGEAATFEATFRNAGTAGLTGLS